MMKTLSKFSCIFLILSISFTAVSAQFAYIPDSAFRSFLNNNGYALAMNGDSLETTSVLVTTATIVNCSGLGISSLEGIQYFNQLRNLNCSINYLSTLPVLSDSLIDLDCSKNLITALPPMPIQLNNFIAHHNRLDTLPIFSNVLFYLDCSTNLLTNLPTLPTGLHNLKCDSNYIERLPTLPNQLASLIAFANLLDSLPQIPSSMRYIDCQMNNITFLPSMPDSLLTLNVAYNQIDSLSPTLPTQLTYFACSVNNIDTIPALPLFLEYLYAELNNIRNLPSLPSSLTRLIVSQNHLSSIPVLPPNLRTLAVASNLLNSLPTLPNSLTILDCGNNNIDTLLPYPPNLQALDVQSNNIRYLQPSTPTLTWLNCSFNFITELPDLPDSLYVCSIKNNPIRCMPTIRKINYFEWDSTLITCFPNQIEITGSSAPDIDNYPLCQPSSGCEVMWSISGSIYHDENNNCIKDSGEQSLRNVPVYLDSAGVHLQSFSTNDNGLYSFRAPLGTYEVLVNPNALSGPMSCPQTGRYTVTLTANDSLQDTLNFGITCPDAFDLIANSVTPLIMFRPTRLVEVQIVAGDLFGKFGTACYDSTGFVECNFSGPISFVGPAQGALTPIFTAPGNLRWNVSDFSTTDPLTSFNIEVRVDSFASIQSSICFQLGAYPFIGDVNPLNNTTSICYPVQNSMDPNEKLMIPSGSVDTSDRVFNFTVFFQNTGNAPAEDIFIIDTLDADLDASTFEFISSSHSVITQILPGNILRFNFPGINLADSVSNETMSHGQVQFRVNRLSSTGMGTEITNTAYIYFDQNLPIATNTVSAIVTSLVSVNSNSSNSKLFVYPNPVNKTLRIANTNSSNGTIDIYNLVGEKISTFELKQEANQEFDTSELLPGVYIIQLLNDSGRRTGRFIKQ